MTPYRLLVLCLILIAGSLRSQTYTPESVPNSRLSDISNHISNPDNILTQEAVSSINSMLTTLEANSTAEVAVVVLQSIGEADEFDFAQTLFNNWGIGKSATNNGLLILLVNDKRNIRFHTGYGLEGILPDIVCKQIQVDHMLPRFREGDIDGGMIAGITELVKILNDPVYADEIKGQSQQRSYEVTRDPLVEAWEVLGMFTVLVGITIILVGLVVYLVSLKKPNKNEQYPEMRNKPLSYVGLYAFIPFAILVGFLVFPVHTAVDILLRLAILYVYVIILLFRKRYRMNKVLDRLVDTKHYARAVAFIQSYQSSWMALTFLFPVPAMIFYFQLHARKRWLRNHPRTCGDCGKMMNKLGEKEDNAYLKENQAFEESLRSVDYDVWLCPACSAVKIEEYTRSSSKYQPCPKCQTHAFLMTGSRTISNATYSAAGIGEQIEECKFCHHIVTSTYTIPIMVSSSNSSDSSSFSGSSGGSSYGGGSSGGGGASSSW